MCIAIVLLLGMTNMFFAMERIPADSDNNPFIQNNLTSMSPACIPLQQPTAPCNSCVQNDEIIVLLKNKNLLTSDFRIATDTSNLKSLEEALEQKSIANQKKKLADLYKVLKKKLSLLGHKDAVDDIYQKYIRKENNCDIKEFINELFALISPDDKQIKNESWTLSENLNNAFGLIYKDVNNLVFDWYYKKVVFAYFSFLGFLFLATFKSRLVHKNSFIALFSSFCFYKGLLAHSAHAAYVSKGIGKQYELGPERSCPCHNKKNNTLKCAYRLIYCGLGSLLFLYIFFKRA